MTTSITKTRAAIIIFAALFFAPAALWAKPKLAVMTIVDGTKRLKPSLLDALTDALRGRLAQSDKYVVIDKGRQARALKKLVRSAKRASYKNCYASKCQIPLGQALAADTILRTKISHVGSTYLLNAELVDLAKEAVTGAGQASISIERGMSRDDRLLDAVAIVAAKLVGGSAAMPGPDGSLSPEPAPTGVDPAAHEDPREVQARYEAQRRAILAQQRARTRNRSTRSDRRKRLTYLIYGWTSIASGALAAGAGVYYMTAKVGAERDNADKATSASGIDRAAKAAKSARNTGITMISLGALAGGVGAFLLYVAGKLDKPAKVGAVELDRLPTTGPAPGGWAMSYGGRF